MIRIVLADYKQHKIIATYEVSDIKKTSLIIDNLIYKIMMTNI